jgi:hypothetical protein
MGGTLYTAHPEAYRTHKDDADPIVATFEDVLSAEEIAHIKEVATPKLRCVGCCGVPERGVGTGRCLTNLPVLRIGGPASRRTREPAAVSRRGGPTTWRGCLTTRHP